MPNYRKVLSGGIEVYYGILTIYALRLPRKIRTPIIRMINRAFDWPVVGVLDVNHYFGKLLCIGQLA